jgi:hypothetical protein
MAKIWYAVASLIDTPGAFPGIGSEGTHFGADSNFEK